MTDTPVPRYEAVKWQEPWLDRQARNLGQAPAIMWQNETIRYADLSNRITQVANSLKQFGVQDGEVLAVLLPNGLPMVEIVHAGFRNGFIALLINSRLRATEIEFQLLDSGAEYFIHLAGDEVAEKIQLTRDVTRIRIHEMPFQTQLRIAEEPPQEPAPKSSQRKEPNAFQLDQPRFILYTSGTTGRPKGVTLSAANLLASANGSAASLGAKRSDRWLLCLPIYHIGGLSILLRCVLAGSTVVLHEKFSPEQINHDLDTKRVTGISLVANMLHRVLEARTTLTPPDSLACVLLGGGPASDSLISTAFDAGFPIALTYGLTEAASQVATRSPHAKTTAELKPLKGISLLIVDEAGCPLPPNQPGEICVRGASVTSGYWNRPDTNASTLRNGWLHTGDIGSVNTNGELTVYDRRSDLIVSGGENIYPAEIEAALLEHASILEVGVSGVPDKTYGARPVAWLVAKPGFEHSSHDALRDHCRERLASFKCPIQFHWTDSLPRTSTGKLLRRKLGDIPR